jgi:hypothetical protein
MPETRIEEQLSLLQQQTVLAGEEIETLRLNCRAEIDALRLEIEALWRCLHLVHPDMAKRFAAVRAEAIHTTDPEAL